MEKFKKVIELKGSILDLNYNKFDKFIYSELEMRSSGDWNECKDGDEISYDFELLEKCDDEELCYIDDYNLNLEDGDKVLLEDLKKYVGEGICYSGSYDEDNWYNVEFVDDVMVISFIYVENY
jgi:hypothetical protein